MPKMIAPGTGNSYALVDGTLFTPGPDGTVDVPPQYIQQMVAIGFSIINDTPVDATSGRPAGGMTAGMMFFDSTLGKPIWRNAGNTGWVLADGTAA